MLCKNAFKILSQSVRKLPEPNTDKPLKVLAVCADAVIIYTLFKTVEGSMNEIKDYVKKDSKQETKKPQHSHTKYA